MCFSAEASFGVGAVLLPAGLYCLRSAARKAPSYLALAALPLVFSMQQFCEGVVWVGLGNDNLPLAKGAALAFLFFALFFWPFWVPFSVSFIETRNTVGQLLSGVSLLALVFGWALYAPILLHSDRWLSVRVVRHSVQYDFAVLPAFNALPAGVWHLLYLGCISCPLFVSFNRPFMLFAVLLAVSALISHLVFWYAFESVWCFFAAALSVQLCYAFRELPTPGRDDRGLGSGAVRGG